MRNILFIGLIALLLGSCSTDSTIETPSYTNDYVAVATVDMPEEFQLGQSYSIDYTYNRPTTCHIFNDLVYNEASNVHTIVIRNTVITGGGADCTPLTDEVINNSFDFSVTSNETHFFRFWQGKDTSDQDIYLEFEVPVN